MAHGFWDTKRRFDKEKSDLSRRNASTFAAMHQSARDGRTCIEESRELIRKAEEILARDGFPSKGR